MSNERGVLPAEMYQAAMHTLGSSIKSTLSRSTGRVAVRTTGGLGKCARHVRSSSCAVRKRLSLQVGFLRSHPVLSGRVPSRLVPSRPVQSCPVSSRPVWSRPVLSRPVPSSSVPSVPSCRSVPSRPVPGTGRDGTGRGGARQGGAGRDGTGRDGTGRGRDFFLGALT